MVDISFPGLKIAEFSIDPVAFRIPIFGGLEVRWYGLIITIGIILAFLYCTYRARQVGISFDDLTDIALFTVIFAIIGARLYYVLTSLDEYDSIGEALAIWNGGLAIYGAIIAGAITIFVMCRIKKLPVLKLLDIAAPGVMLGQLIGRWGNFCNGEAYGGVIPQNSPLYFLRMGIYPNNISGVSGMAYVHPTFLYESLWNLCGFILINLIYKKKKFDGQIVLMYATWYGFGRMLIEGLRTDSLYVGVFRISQVIGFICFIGGAIALTVLLVKARRKELTAQDYEPSYPKFVTTASLNMQDARNGSATVISDSDAENYDNEGEEETEHEDADNVSSDVFEYTDVTDKISRLYGNSENHDETSKENENGTDN